MGKVTEPGHRRMVALRRRLTSLSRDEGGAMMIMGLPMMLILVGMVFYSVGVGEAILHRERLQDAADAAAFSASIMMARGMNLLVLINMVMAAVLSVLVALRMVEMLAYAGMAIASAIGWFFPPALSAIPFMTQTANTARTAYNNLSQPVQTILQGLHAAGQGVKYAMPIAAQVRVVTTVTQNYRPEARFAFAIPYQFPLPTRDGAYPDLCEEAGRVAGSLIAAPLEPLPGQIRRAVANGVGDLAGGLSSWVCGGGGPPPVNVDMSAVESELKSGLPPLDEELACQEQARQNYSNTDPGALPDTSVCDEAEAAVQASKPDTETGGCKQNPEGSTERDELGRALGTTTGGVADCGSYYARAEGARVWCDPSQHTDRNRDDWEWQVREITLRAERQCRIEGEGEAAQEVCRAVHLTPRLGPPRYQHTGRSVLCGRGGTLGEEWNAPRNTAYADLPPVCEEEDRRAMPEHGEPIPEELDYWNFPFYDQSGFTIDGGVLEITHTQVLHVLGCAEVKTPEQVEREFNIPEADRPPDTQPSGTNGCGTPNNRVHQEVSQETLGEEEYQMRIITVGRRVRQRPRELIQRLSAGNRSAGEMQDLLGEAAGLAQIFVAQSEFYFDWERRDDEFHGDYRDPKRWMWSMLWRARLRRFRMPDGDGDSGGATQSSGCAEAPPASIGDACSNAEGSDNDDCGGGLDGMLDAIDAMIIH